MKSLRVAFFTDSYHEVNGVALTSREFAGFSRPRGLPFFSVHPGPETRHWREGNLETFELADSHLVLNLEHDLRFDLMFLRHRSPVRERLAEFNPDLVHVTGPGHIGLLGALLAHDLRVPLVASWHTNVHEYGARRLNRLLGGWSQRWREGVVQWAEETALTITLWFYRKARLLFAPNQELVDLLATRTNKPVCLMQRGIDCRLFTPSRRTRRDDRFVVGYVGRLSPEKNVRQLEALERALVSSGAGDVSFLIVGDGSEREWLRRNLHRANLPGVQRGEELAESYANMDVFAFPSETDTFGNVVLEAQASGVPAVVTGSGGPKFLVEPGVDGFVASDVAGFSEAVLKLYRDRELLDRLREGARRSAMARSWDEVFEGVYRDYAQTVACGVDAQVQARPLGGTLLYSAATPVNPGHDLSK